MNSDHLCRSLLDSWEQLEALAGVAAAFFIGYCPPVVLLFVTFATLEQRQWAWSLVAGAGFVFSLALAVWVTRLTGASLYDRYPQFRPVKSSKNTGDLRGNSMDDAGFLLAGTDEASLRDLIDDIEAQIRIALSASR